MTDDLISRQALLAAYDERHKGPPGGARELIEDAPSVPAVPLDKLCKFLGKATHPCILLAIGCPYDKSNCEECDSCNAWKATLTKWMEEQDADD